MCYLTRNPIRLLFTFVVTLCLSLYLPQRVDAQDDYSSAVCPQSVQMTAHYNNEFFRGEGNKEADLTFWSRYRFVAYNLGGTGGIEMKGFFYLSKAECYFDKDGIFHIIAPVIEYYGPARDNGFCNGDTRLVIDDSYDPYASDSRNCGDMSNGGDDGAGTGGGTQYNPGDSTGGETVDWGTGQGNGGSSQCGASAVVEYVCIDYWDGEKWAVWGCGYVTTC